MALWCVAIRKGKVFINKIEYELELPYNAPSMSKSTCTPDMSIEPLSQAGSRGWVSVYSRCGSEHSLVKWFVEFYYGEHNGCHNLNDKVTKALLPGGH